MEQGAARAQRRHAHVSARGGGELRLLQASEFMIAGNPEAMARVVEGIITGMGFIGGGAILRMKDSVRGTATAASLWATGAIGTAV
jgi:putative Mg2+ transporter-C (MgtC) family protein